VSFLIRHYKSDQFTDVIWSGTLADAQDTFCQSVRDGTFDRVEIRDANNEPIFHYPLEVHLASPGR
jgi:hypothetical protein